MKDYYKVLDINKESTDDEIKKAYRALCMRWHPDRNKNDIIAENKMKEINEAYQTLGDQNKRHMYDAGIDPNQQGGFNHNTNLNDILRTMGFNINIDMSGSNPFAAHPDQQSRMQIKQQINITLKDAVFGCDIELDIPSYINCKDCNGIGGNKNTCHKCAGAGQNVTFLGAMQFPALCVTCNGKGYVLTSACHSCNQQGFKKKSKHLKLKIPAGIQNHSAMHIAPADDERSDIFVIVNIMKHDKISRNGATLFSTEFISCFDAMVGGIKKVDTIDGNVDLIIPPGTQHGQQLVIENHGGILSNGRANHVVNVHIEIPTNLTPAQIKKISEIKEKIKN